MTTVRILSEYDDGSFHVAFNVGGKWVEGDEDTPGRFEGGQTLEERVACSESRPHPDDLAEAPRVAVETERGGEREIVDPEWTCERWVDVPFEDLLRERAHRFAEDLEARAVEAKARPPAPTKVGASYEF